MRRFAAGLFLTLFLGIHAVALLAPFVSPYSPTYQFRESFLRPPDRLHFVDQAGGWHLQPFIYEQRRVSDLPAYVPTGRKLFLRFLVRGEPDQGRSSGEFRLFGLEDANQQVFLFGSDSLGRDLFSRVLFAVRFSLAVGLLSILGTISIGVLVGSIAGYWGGWWDSLLMRIVDLFIALPGLFLILGIRALFPFQLSSDGMFWLIVLVFTLAGWASVTRVIRGQVISIKARPHVQAARLMGASHSRVVFLHILPLTTSYLLVQATVFLPLFILGEVTLSFLGVGVQEPQVSLGILLNTAATGQAILQHRWLLLPAGAIFLLVLCWSLLGDQLKAQGRQRAGWL